MSAPYRTTFEQMFEAAKLCRDQALDVPMLVLIYTSLDTLAWAVYGDETSEVQRRFISLCETYVLPGAGISCTAPELYAARCSVVHTLGWESKLSKSKGVRAFHYSVGDDDPRLAQEVLDHVRPGEFLAIKADDLLTAAQRAVERVAQVASSDQSLAARLATAEGKQYRSLESKAGGTLFEAYLEKVRCT